MISSRELLLAFALPALLCVVLGALAARRAAGRVRRLLQALAVALPFLVATWASSGYVPYLQPLGSATQVVPLLALPVGALAALLPVALPLLGSLVLGWMMFGRLAAPPGWFERVAAVVALASAWTAGRTGTERTSWRPLLALATFAGAVAFACLCGRSADLAKIAGGFGTMLGTSFVVSLRKPNWSPGRPGLDVGVFVLGGTLAGAVYLAYLGPLAALVLLASLAVARIPSFKIAFAAQLALTALGLVLAWPEGGLGA